VGRRLGSEMPGGQRMALPHVRAASIVQGILEGQVAHVS
jgi:hypothetical protein